METTILKVSDTEIKRVRIIPEKVIPEQRTEETISLSEVRTQLNTVLKQIEVMEIERANYLKPVDASLAIKYAERDALQDEMSQAEELGVKIELPKVEPTPDEKLPEEQLNDTTPK
ncbi:MAG: hypothetical protein NT155_03770 [Candidatus Staskawiczbacteria bacterium]|nr:hypothetical protein [Candidatus Staskawiczbacteria bacterium]